MRRASRATPRAEAGAAGSGGATGGGTGAAGSAGLGAAFLACTTGRSKGAAGTAFSPRRRHHRPAKISTSSPAAPAIQGQYQPGQLLAAAEAGAGRDIVAGTAASDAGVSLRGAAVAGIAGMAAGAVCLTGAIVRRGAAAGVGAVLATGLGVALADGVGGALWAGRGAVVVTTGFSPSTGPCAPGGAGRTVAPGKRQSLTDWASSGAGTSASASAAAPACQRRSAIRCIAIPVQA